MAPVAYQDVADGTGIQGSIFSDKKFFLTARLPMRSHLASLVETNGGQLVKLEKQADYVIADHLRADAPPGSLSYTFIEAAIAKGGLPEECEHPAGKAANTVREVASTAPGKTTRTPFTAEDDRVLWQWVKTAEASGVAVKGNELYKQLEAKNPRHTFQSWRDRYVRHLSFKPPASLPTPPLDLSSGAADADEPQTEVLAQPAPAVSNAPKTNTSARLKSKVLLTQRESEHAAAPEQDRLARLHDLPEPDMPLPREATDFQEPEGHVEAVDQDQDSGPATADPCDSFADEDMEDWVQGAAAIQDIPVGKYQRAWIAFADHRPQHTADEWRAFYENRVLPIYLENEQAEPNEPGTGHKDDWPDAEGRAHYGDIIRAFGTQGQPIIAPSRPPSSATTPPKNAHPVQTKSFVALTGAPSHSPAKLLTKSPKRKLFDSDQKAKLSRTSQKRRRVEGQTAEDAQLPSQDAILISSDSSSSEYDEDEERVTGQLTSDVDLAVQRQLLSEMRQEKGELTAENLARVRSDHEPPRTRRGVDLAEDDEDKDQDAYAGYLEGLLGVSASVENVDAARDNHVAEESAQHPRSESRTIKETRPGPLHHPTIPRLIETQFIDPDLEMSSPIHASQEEFRQRLDADISPLPRLIETQDIDPDLFIEDDIKLELPEPKGGWETYSSQTSLPQSPTISAAASAPLRDKGKGRVVRAQEVFNAESQQPDLDVPEPNTLSEQTNLGSPLSGEALETFFEELMEHGFREEDIMTALMCTSMQQDLVELVLQYLAKGREVPRNVAGVWSSQEDAVLEGGDAVKLRVLEEKHGSEEYMRRLKFLDDHRNT
ncbi:hypothetical protein MBLNU459_g8526t1 [Dothideomycetes sp. NU459]